MDVVVGAIEAVVSAVCVEVVCPGLVVVSVYDCVVAVTLLDGTVVSSLGCVVVSPVAVDCNAVVDSSGALVVVLTDGAPVVVGSEG